MAEGLLRRDHGDKFEVKSAGTKAASVRSEATQAMKEICIDYAGHTNRIHRGIDDPATGDA